MRDYVKRAGCQEFWKINKTKYVPINHVSRNGTQDLI